MDLLCDTYLGKVNGGMTGKEIKAIWTEYEDNQTLEAKFVHDVDKLELLLQMLEYERSREGKLDLGEFAWVAEKIECVEVKQWTDDLMREREAFWHSVRLEPGPGSISTEQGSADAKHML